MATHNGFSNLLTSPQHDAVARFMRAAILDKIDQENKLSFSGMGASPYSWIYAIGTFGTIFPSISQLWKEWWSMPTTGRAYGVLQYTSALMYPNDKNPIFRPWSPEYGGGAPTLWETGNSTDEKWLPENINFLRETLTFVYIQESIAKSITVLEDNINSTTPKQMAHDLEGARSLVELRIAELLQYLSQPLEQVWSQTTSENG
jgi:hypothetical protein